MAKQILHSDEARKKLKTGIDSLADAVKVTLGPKGRLVAIGRKFQAPAITKDGVTVAKSIELEDPIENMGAQIIKEAATKTADLAGDGTTSATVIAQAIIEEGVRNVTAGANPMEIKKGIDRGVLEVTKALKKMAREVETKEQIEHVATISGNNDKTIGETIASIMDKIGNDGVATIDESTTGKDEIEFVDGMEFDKGYISPYFITDPDKMRFIAKDMMILLTDARITLNKEIVGILDKMMNEGHRDLLIIAEDVDAEALATLVVNKMKGILNVVAVKCPGFGDNRAEILKDLAALTGATVISEKLGKKIDMAEFVDLGMAGKVIITKDSTTIIEGKGSKKEVNKRVKLIRAQIKESTSEYDREKLQERAAKLTGGVAIFKVGGATEVELKERKDRVDDAMCATRAAVEEGIVSGGGVAYFDASKSLDALIKKTEGDVQTGVKILKRALEEPARRIAENAGLNGDVVISHIGKGIGFNAAKGNYTRMIRSGIVDPTKVCRMAVQNGASVAVMFLTTEAVVGLLPEKENPNTPNVPYMS